jgi:hypothetical protein
LELWPSSNIGATTIAFLRASSSAFFRASYFFLLALIYRDSAALPFFAC